MRLFRGGIAFIFLTLIVSSFVAMGQEKKVLDWPIFRGNPAQTGVGVTNLPDKLELRWKFQCKESIDGAAAIADGIVYVGSLDEHFYAIDLKTGQQLWKYKADPFKAPPSVKDGLVYVGDEGGLFHCIDAKTGQKKWTFETGSEIVGGAGFAGDNVIFGSYDSTLYCLNKNGQLVWKFAVNGPVNGSPAIAGNRTFVAGCDSSLHIIDTNNGKELAAIDLGSQTGATPAVLGEHAYVGTMANQVHAIDLKNNKIGWSFEAAQRSQPYYASAAVTDDLVIIGSRDKNLYALDRAKGTVVWHFTTKGRVDGSAVVVGKRVYAPSLDGSLYVLDLAKGTLLQKLDLGRGIAASPAVSGDALVVGTTDGVLYCFGKKE